MFTFQDRVAGIVLAGLMAGLVAWAAPQQAAPACPASAYSVETLFAPCIGAARHDLQAEATARTKVDPTRVASFAPGAR
jgi:hypothetical protein